MTVAKRNICDSPNMRHSASDRIELVKQRFSPRSVKIENSHEISFQHPHILRLTDERTEGENHSHPDNRATQPKQEISRTTQVAKVFSQQHSLGHVNCGACEYARRVQMVSLLSPEMKFSEAYEKWIASRTFGDTGERRPGMKRRHRFLSDHTLKSYRAYSSCLKVFFADLPLKDIHLGNFRRYQEMRADVTSSYYLQRREDWKESGREIIAPGPNKINQELGLVEQILDRAGLWKDSELEKYYEPLLTEESDIPRALTPDEQERWLVTAESRERWRPIYCYTLIGLCTTCSTQEMRGIHLGDIFDADAILQVRHDSSKNRKRMRSIPLNEEAMFAVNHLRERAKKLGSYQSFHYLFPFRQNKDLWVPERPMSEWGIRKPWDEVREAADLPNFAPNDLRHTAITRYAEAGTPIPVIQSIAGHMSPKMTAHYTWICEQAKRQWQGRLAKRSPQPETRFHAAAAGQQ